MSSQVFTCEVTYLGNKYVNGAQSTSSLGALVEELLHPRPHAHAHPHTPLHHHLHHLHLEREEKTENLSSFTNFNSLPRCIGKGSERYLLVCDEEQLRLNPVRKDEGFESDTESSGSACEDPCCRQDVKVISDHVLRLDQLINDDGTRTKKISTDSSSSSLSSSSSSNSSSGAESEDDSPRPPHHHHHHHLPQQRGPNGGGGGGGGGVDIQVSDILFCHVSGAWPRVLVVAARAAGSAQVSAHVFQCPTPEAARALYAHYRDASSRYRLSRYRNSRRRGEGDVGRGSGRGCAVRAAECGAGVQVIPVGQGLGAAPAWGVGGTSVCVGAGVHHLHNGVTQIEIPSGPPSLGAGMGGGMGVSLGASLGGSLGPAGGREVMGGVGGEVGRMRQREHPSLLPRPQEARGRSRRDAHEGAPVPHSPVLQAPERPSRARAPRSHSKGRAPAPPPPPPRRHPHLPGVLLVPTKSGAEHARALYPKDSLLHHALLQRRPHEYHAPRPRDVHVPNPEARRRARSKSPARRAAMPLHPLAPLTAFSLTQKIRDLSGAVFGAPTTTAPNTAGGAAASGHRRSLSTGGVAAAGGEGGSLRPVIKRGRRPDGSPPPRRVTFSAYATVQVMDA